MDTTAQDLLDFWLGVGSEGWYRVDDALDATIRTRWGELWERGGAGELAQWITAPRSCLALVILLDQFPRNMFRQDPRAFDSDARALMAASAGIARGHDKRVALPERQFFYMPFMHSEVQTNQDRSVRLFLLNFGRGDSLRHAQVHREIIRRFGRFPYRNAALGRESTAEELAFLKGGGYPALLEQFAP